MDLDTPAMEGLVALKPLPKFMDQYGMEHFYPQEEPKIYRILGDVNDRGDSNNLAVCYMEELLSDPDKNKGHWKGVYKIVLNGMDFVIEGMSREIIDDEPSNVRWQIHTTLGNYYASLGQAPARDETKARFESYRGLLIDAYNGVARDLDGREDFIKMVRFFRGLEKARSYWGCFKGAHKSLGCPVNYDY